MIIKLFDPELERSNPPTANSKDIKEINQEGLRIGILVENVFPFSGKFYSTFLYFVPA
jgi:hypothetical protein